MIEIAPYLTRDRKRKGYICPFCGSGTGRTGTGMTKNPRTQNFHCWNCSRDYSNLDLYAKLKYDYSVQETTNHYQELIAEIQGDNMPLDVTTLAKLKAQKKFEETPKEQFFTETEKFELTLWSNIYATTSMKQISVDTPEELIKELQQHSHKIKSKSVCFTNPTINNLLSKEEPNIRPSRLIPVDVDACTRRQSEDFFEFLETKSTINWNSHSYTEELPRVKALVVLDKSPSTKSKYKDEVLKLYEEIESSIKPHPISEMTDVEYKALIETPLQKLQEKTPKATVKDLDCVNERNEYIFKLDKSAISIAHAQYCPPLGNEIYITSGETQKIKSIFKNSLDYLNTGYEEQEPIQTGYKSLDKILNGGLVNGLYLLGAISSVGKSAFCLNLCDNLAKNGIKVLYVTIEMCIEEHQRRSLIRCSNGALTHSNFNENKKNKTSAYLDAVKVYSEYAKNIYFIDSVREIETIYLNLFSLDTKVKYVMIIDYLQLLDTSNERAKTNEYSKLNEISYTLKNKLSKLMPIVAISSINRDNYKSKEHADLSVFKGSGNLEYDSNVCMFMYSTIANDNVKEITLQVLKNRNGLLDKCNFEFITNKLEFKELKEVMNSKNDRF